MANHETNWTTVSGKQKTKSAASATKPSGIPVMPKAETKTIKLSDSPFSSMKNRSTDENDADEIKTQKSTTNPEINPSIKATKPTKTTSNSLTLKQALQNIDANKLKQLYQSSKDNPSLRVDNICYWFIEQFRNVTSGLTDPVFAKENNQNYPFDTLPGSVKKFLNEIFDMNSKLKAITLCRIRISHPNTDIHDIIGCQVLLQYLLRNLGEQPNKSFFDEVDELSASLKRYPSDKVLRLLWAYSQVLYEYPDLGLDIWFRLMFPFIENRTYNHFIVDNLSQITIRMSKSKAFCQSDRMLPIVSYIKLTDFVDRPNPALTREMRTSLVNSTTSLADLFLKNAKNLSQYSNEYFKVLFPVAVKDKFRSSKMQSIIDRMILACINNKSIIGDWLSYHENYPQSSLHLLSLLQTDKTSIPALLSSSKQLRTITQQLLTISNRMINNETNDNVEHHEFLRIYNKNNQVVVNEQRTPSKSRIAYILKLIVLIFISYTIYSNWLWLTVAADYLLEDYFKHPTIILIRERLADTYIESKNLCLSSLKYAEEFCRSMTTKMEPYAIQIGQYIQKQWTFLQKYIEGPIYDKCIDIAEQIQRLLIIIFNQSVHYLNILFDGASYYTANIAQTTEVYIKQIYMILYDKWNDFDVTQFREKFDQLRMRIMKSF